MYLEPRSEWVGIALRQCSFIMLIANLLSLRSVM